jgi:hypothetical protein
METKTSEEATIMHKKLKKMTNFLRNVANRITLQNFRIMKVASQDSEVGVNSSLQRSVMTTMKEDKDFTREGLCNNIWSKIMKKKKQRNRIQVKICLRNFKMKGIKILIQKWLSKSKMKLWKNSLILRGLILQD